MANSQTYGPSQVRDLSESWGKDTQSAKAVTPLALGLPEAHVCLTTPSVESHPLASTIFQSRSTLHVVPNGSLASHTAGIGARFFRVKGSTPSTVTYGDKCRPVHSTPALRRINTLAAKKYCGS